MITNCIIAEIVAMILFSYWFYKTGSFTKSSWASVCGLSSAYTLLTILLVLEDLENIFKNGFTIQGPEILALALLVLLHFTLLGIISRFLEASRFDKNE